MEKAAINRTKKTEEEMREQFQANRGKWLKEQGFNAEGKTYVVKGETYAIKDQLKEDGFSFNKTLLWHSPVVVEGYEDKIMEFSAEDLAEFAAWGSAHYFSDSAKRVKDLVNPQEELPHGDWLEGEKFANLKATLKRKGSYNGRYGLSNIYTFVTEAGNVLTWFTTTTPEVEVGETVLISGNIKDRTEYKNVKQTNVSRVKVKPVVE